MARRRRKVNEFEARVERVGREIADEHPDLASFAKLGALARHVVSLTRTETRPEGDALELPDAYRRVVDLLRGAAPEFVSDAKVKAAYDNGEKTGTKARTVIKHLRDRYELKDHIETAPKRSPSSGWRWV